MGAIPKGIHEIIPGALVPKLFIRRSLDLDWIKPSKTRTVASPEKSVTHGGICLAFLTARNRNSVEASIVDIWVMLSANRVQILEVTRISAKFEEVKKPILHSQR